MSFPFFPILFEWIGSKMCNLFKVNNLLNICGVMITVWFGFNAINDMQSAFGRLGVPKTLFKSIKGARCLCVSSDRHSLIHVIDRILFSSLKHDWFVAQECIKGKKKIYLHTLASWWKHNLHYLLKKRLVN